MHKWSVGIRLRKPENVNPFDLAVQEQYRKGAVAVAPDALTAFQDACSALEIDVKEVEDMTVCLIPAER